MKGLREKTSKIIGNKFVRSVAYVAGGTVAAQLITVGFAPVITRLYGPDAFGMLAIFSSLTVILTPLGSLAYVHAIALPADDRDALALLRLSLRIALLFGLLVLVLFGLFRDQIAALFGFDSMGPYLLLIAPVIVLATAEQGFSQWLIRKKKFKAIGGVAVAQASLLGGGKTGFGFVLPTGLTLVVLAMVGHLIQALLLLIMVRPSLPEKVVNRAPKTFSRGSSVAWAYRDFPYYRAPQIFIHAISQSLPLLMLAALFGPAVAGFYALGHRILQLPATVISNSVGKVFLAHIAEAAREGKDIKNLLIKSTTALAVIGLLPFGFVVLLGPQLFSFAFGSEWGVAGEYARWLSLFMFFTFINTPCVKAKAILGVQKHFLIYETVLVVARFIGILAGVYVSDNPILAILFFSLTGVVANFTLIIWIISISSTRRRQVLESAPSLNIPNS